MAVNARNLASKDPGRNQGTLWDAHQKGIHKINRVLKRWSGNKNELINPLLVSPKKEDTICFLERQRGKGATNGPWARGIQGIYLGAKLAPPWGM